jgi:archaellum biogenesis ATPase FlaH
LIEQTILTNLIHNEEYVRKVLPYIKKEYFQDYIDRSIFESIEQHFTKYNACPSIDALRLDAGNNGNYTEDQYKAVGELLSSLQPTRETFEWLLDQTETFCKDKAIYNAIMESISVIDGKSSKSRGALPGILTDALAVSFDPHVGHDFIEDAEDRWEFYHQKEIKLPFDIDLLNDVTKGGLSKKTLNVVLAGTGVGKSMFMCHCAAGNLRDNKNVLYVTLEMAEEKIAERIDANLMGLTIDEVHELSKEVYEKKITRLKNNYLGKIVIKEYPTTGANVNHLRYLLNELKIKKSFVPDIIYVDYLNIMMSSRMKYGAGVNSYTYIKAIAEELRGLAVEFNVPVVSATQTTRSGYTSTDLGLEDTSESFGLPATADFMFAIISTEELQDLNQILVKQLKNRYSDPSFNRRFIVGVDRAKMTLYNVEQSAQDDVLDEAAVFDNSEVHNRNIKEAFNDFV